MPTWLKKLQIAGAALGVVMLTLGIEHVRAEDEIRIGVIYPLTGAAASTGVELKAAVELAAALTNREIPAPKTWPPGWACRTSGAPRSG